jgi:hypothetical protein
MGRVVIYICLYIYTHLFMSEDKDEEEEEEEEEVWYLETNMNNIKYVCQSCPTSYQNGIPKSTQT